MILTGFDGLDAISGGLQEKKNYLIYGDIGTGKTTFALQFLYQGLISGENVAMITRRSAPTIFEHGQAFGLDLEPFVRTDQLIIFEYVSKVVENSTRLKDEEQIWRELLAFLGDGTIQRMVFDPITPLLAAPSSSAAIFRARSLVHSFSQLEATCLYLFDTPEGQEYLGNCKDFVLGVLRLEAAAGQHNNGKMFLERFAGQKGRANQIDFEVTPGIGLASVAPAQANGNAAGAAPAAQRKVLIIESDSEQRKFLTGLLEKQYNVLQSAEPADGLAKVASEEPDLIILDKEIKGLDGLEICKKLRHNKLNVPIVLVADQTRHAHDRFQMMKAGVDEIMERPIDGRILKLKVQNLLHRYDGSKTRRDSAGLDTSVTTEIERDQTTCTTNLAYFYDRIRSEITHSAENGLSLVVLALRLPKELPGHKELCDMGASLMREYDLLFSDDRGVYVLLAETEEKGVKAYLSRLEQRWKLTPTPEAEYEVFNRRDDFITVAKQLVEGHAHTDSSMGAGESPSA
jgi:DNA-binding response OmpR family regulator/KaiC/GvpD/RAD55 family RecA-like ATPase